MGKGYHQVKRERAWAELKKEFKKQLSKENIAKWQADEIKRKIQAKKNKEDAKKYREMMKKKDVKKNKKK